ncbi:hypothetical protein [Amycolatopsis sp. H20-H5]|uniref:hypothetical protein n=1 Tax=Amycolatopsis sp. H20-H5 TaxID=3046309 RepID=UPI002DB7D27C|nr:hypothetical protein [Amycolatopsis sp. H20-H5]MEC3974675.1 hypothetical protein [Amycolatopsis sp. H20-H5]
MGQQPNTVTDSLTSVPPPAPIQVGSGGSAGGYKFSPDEVQGVINQWKKLQSDLLNDVTNAQTVASVKPPGTEFASGDFIDKGAKISGDTLLEQHKRMYTYVSNYIEALEKASGKIKQGEADAAHATGKSGQGV